MSLHYELSQLIVETAAPISKAKEIEAHHTLAKVHMARFKKLVRKKNNWTGNYNHRMAKYHHNRHLKLTDGKPVHSFEDLELLKKWTPHYNEMRKNRDNEKIV